MIIVAGSAATANFRDIVRGDDTADNIEGTRGTVVSNVKCTRGECVCRNCVIDVQRSVCPYTRADVEPFRICQGAARKIDNTYT